MAVSIQEQMPPQAKGAGHAARPRCLDWPDQVQKSMSPMPPIPPMPPPGGPPADALRSGRSATIASVVISSAATEAAPCSAVRTTLVGSMMPAAIRSLYPPVCAPAKKPLAVRGAELVAHDAAGAAAGGHRP